MGFYYSESDSESEVENVQPNGDETLHYWGNQCFRSNEIELDFEQDWFQLYEDDTMHVINNETFLLYRDEVVYNNDDGLSISNRDKIPYNENDNLYQMSYDDTMNMNHTKTFMR